MRLEPHAAHYDADQRTLVVDLRPELDVRIRFGPWSEGLPCHRWSDGAWHAELSDPCLEVFGAAGASLASDPDHPIAQYLGSTPAEHLDLLQGYRDFELTVLRLLRHAPGRELAVAAPNLLWLLAAALGDRQIPAFAYESYLRHRRRDLLAWVLGRDARPSHVRLLERVTPTRRDAHTRARVFRLLARADLRDVIDHGGPITSDQIDAALALRHHLHVRAVVEALASSDPWAGHAIAKIADDTCNLGALLGIPDAHLIVRRISAPRDLEHLHRRWTERANLARNREDLDRLAATFGTRVFPPPPIPSTAAIVHVGTLDALLAEGQEMHHCVVAYARACFGRTSAIFRVLAPERATLELRAADGRWTIAQLLLAHNQPVSPSTLVAVRAWARTAVDAAARPDG